MDSMGCHRRWILMQIDLHALVSLDVFRSFRRLAPTAERNQRVEANTWLTISLCLVNVEKTKSDFIPSVMLLQE